MEHWQYQQFRSLVRMMRFEAVKKRLLVCRVGFEQHLDFILLLQFAFPVIEGGRSGEEGYTGSQFFGQYFGGEILGGSFIRGGTQYDNSIRRVHKSTSSSRKWSLYHARRLVINETGRRAARF
ncbi:hypothetical protein APU11_21595 [Enterobacter sp. 50793107]|nr:hypothetical protein ABR35_18525 [Enterobacter cloacae subsp. cloacae]KSY77417.1 hypothetical protein APU11_21595 [Enterobacter sp. 50793107]